jgi:endonuclease/exonuclease/phosphatase family metal-dependent hydrolase
VLLTDGPGRQAAAWSFESDPGKGALLVELGGVLFASVHLTPPHRRAGQLDRLAGLPGSWPGFPVALLGDFNADRDTVAGGLGSGFDVAVPAPGARPTRPGAAGDGGRFIDHVAVAGARVGAVTVEDAGGLSDHHLVRAEIVA